MRLTRRKGQPRIDSRQEPYYPSSPSAQIPHLGFIFEAVFGERQDGCFVEVGGFDGYSASNTWGLAVRGWTGFYFEPIPEFAEMCRNNHRAHPNVSVFETAVSVAGEVDTDFRVSGALTTANQALFDEYGQTHWAAGAITDRRVRASTTSLDTLLTGLELGQGVELLVVDVEGMEEQVFAGFSLEEWMPKAIIVELTDLHPDLKSTRRSDHQIRRRIEAAGYSLVYKDSINSFFVQSALWDGRVADGDY